MDIPRSRFPHEILNIIQHIAESHFIAFDLEFSGIAGRRKAPAGQQRDKLTLQEVYEDVKGAAEKYQILQIGLTVVREDVDRGCYVARPYNFNINPVPTLKERYIGREWSYHSGAVDFLLRNGFRFDLPLTHGVPYLSRKEEGEARATWIREEAEKATLANMPIKDEDMPLINHIRQNISRWQAKPKDEQDEYINIPSEANDPAVPATLNRYQVRLTHQIVRNELPKLKTTGMGHFVQITNPTVDQQASQKAIQEQIREREISKAVGFRWLIEAVIGGDITNMPDEFFMSGVSGDVKPKNLQHKIKKLQEKLRSRRRVIVGHNCLTDLVNLYKCFIGDLPHKVEDFQGNIHALFPAIVDTKHIASFGKGWSDTSLENVELQLKTEPNPKIEIPADFDRYRFTESYHEAGYDSLQTAKVLVKLSAKIERDNKLKDEKPPAGSMSDTFGIVESYVMAPESFDNGKTAPGNLLETISKVVSPLAMIPIGFFQGDSASNESKKDGLDAVLPSNSANTLSSVVAVKEKVVDWSKSVEVKKVKEAFENATLYDILNNDKGDSDGDVNPDLLVFSDDDQEKKNTREEKKRLKEAAQQLRLSQMVAKGEMMPRWNGGQGFWTFFGNKLQVNGIEEKVCRLP